VNCYIPKPIDLDKLFASLEKNTNEINQYKEQDKLLNLLEEYKKTVDLSNIVSKADIDGNITYVNEKSGTYSYRADR
jgi:hypothetical protein